MAASLRVVAAAVCIVVILSLTAQLAVAQTVPDACNDQDCANACQAEANRPNALASASVTRQSMQNFATTV